MTTVGDIVSRLRNIIKATNEDAFLTDRFIYSLVLKYAHLFIKRDKQIQSVLAYSALIQSIPCLELIEVDKVSDRCCAGIKSNCTIMRSKERIPDIIESTNGPLFRSISSLDNSTEFTLTTPTTYISSSKTTTFKYNTTKYYWYVDGYLYFPNVNFEYVKVEGLFEKDLSDVFCAIEKKCLKRQDEKTFIPDYLLAEIESSVIKELALRLQVPEETADNKKNINR
jgi:hypothetical protein